MKIEVHAPEGHYVLRYFDGRLPRYKKLGNDPSEALDELQKAKFQLKFKNEAKTAGYIIPTSAPVKRKSLAEYGREFLEQKRSPSLKLDEDTIKLYTVIVEEFVRVCGKAVPEDIVEGDVIRYCDGLDKRYSDGVRARRYTSLRGFLFYCGLVLTIFSVVLVIELRDSISLFFCQITIVSGRAIKEELRAAEQKKIEHKSSPKLKEIYVTNV